MFEKNNKAKIEKFMQKNGLTLDDMISLYKEEENTEPQPQAEPQPQVDPTPKVDEPKKPEMKVEPAKVEEGKLEIDYKKLYDSLQKENASLKESVATQGTKLDKIYEMLSAQGKTPEGNEFANNIGAEVKTGMNGKEEESDFAKLLGGK